jgi:hypothetical protein
MSQGGRVSRYSDVASALAVRSDKQLAESLEQAQVLGSAMMVDAMSGMVTQVRPPRRDEMNAYYRALPLCDQGRLQPNRRSGDANA